MHPQRLHQDPPSEAAHEVWASAAAPTWSEDGEGLHGGVSILQGHRGRRPSAQARAGHVHDGQSRLRLLYKGILLNILYYVLKFVIFM